MQTKGCACMEGFQQAAVQRQQEDLCIKWEGDNLGTVAIYMDEDPDFQESSASLLGKTAEKQYTVAVSAEKRPYFLLVAENGARIRTAERVIPMDSLVNFRDLGGYLTEDGRRTRWGRLLRSAAHDGITDRDVAFLQHIGLKTVVDYRSGFEENEHPDREIAGVSYQHLRPFEESNATNVLDLAQFQRKTVEDAIYMLTTINRTLGNHPHCNEIYREVVQIALDPAQVPMVQHCTAGKDRVGVGSATLLLTLGVPRETIMADYLLSNENRLSTDKLSMENKNVQLPPEQLKMFEALTKVHEEYLGAFFDEIDKVWGGTEGYLKKGLGLTDGDLDRMKELYLEQM